MVKTCVGVLIESERIFGHDLTLYHKSEFSLYLIAKNLSSLYSSIPWT